MSVSKHMTIDGFMCIPPQDIQAQEIHNTKDDEDQRYVSEVEIEYPKELHIYHNDYLLAQDTIQFNKRTKLRKNLRYKDKLLYNMSHQTIYRTCTLIIFTV